MSAGTHSIQMLSRFDPRRGRGAGGVAARGDACGAEAIGWPGLQQPGSFALCANAEFDGYVAQELARVVEAATRAAARFHPLGVILTGSFARGEGALVSERDGRTCWLSDIDCLVVVPDNEGLSGSLGEALARAVATLKFEAATHSTGLKVQLSPVLSSHLRRMRPSIFTRELAAHGKLLWGNSFSIAIMPPGLHDVPARRADALRLLNNRIMEHVALRAGVEAGKTTVLQRGYGLSKFWTELATSLSIFLDCYRTTYRERRLAIEQALADPQSPFDREFAADIRWGLDAAMLIRRGVLDASQWPEDAGFGRAAELAQRVWDWESARMMTRPDLPIDGNWRAIPRRLRRVATLSQCARDWARWCMRPDVSRRIGLRVVLPSLRSGSPGNAIYAAGCLLEFFWEEIGERRSRGREIAATLGAMFGLCGGSRELPTRRQLVGRAVAAWHSHLSGAAR